MTRKTVVRLALVTGVLLIGCPCAFFGSWAAADAGSSRGSPVLAEEWRAKLAPIDRPEDAPTVRGTQVFRFPSGEWAVGMTASSHGIWVRGGGTVVIKDSRGRVRAFFGHVCGGLPPCEQVCKSLDAFDAWLANNFEQHNFD